MVPIEILDHAKLIALRRLVRIVEESESEREARLAAATILRISDKEGGEFEEVPDDDRPAGRDERDPDDAGDDDIPSDESHGAAARKPPLPRSSTLTLAPALPALAPLHQQNAGSDDPAATGVLNTADILDAHFAALAPDLTPDGTPAPPPGPA